MSCFTLTWQERRTPSRSSPRLRWLRSVGRTAPPPSSTVTLQTPQLPLPPQADGMNRRLSQRVPSSVPPAAVHSALSVSPLMAMVDLAGSDELPPGDHQQADQRHDHEREHRDAESDGDHQSCTPAKAMKPSAISPTSMNVRPSPRSPSGGFE